MNTKSKGRLPWRSIVIGALISFPGYEITTVPLPHAGQVGAAVIGLALVTPTVNTARWARRGRFGMVAMKAAAERRAERNAGYATRWSRLSTSSAWAMRYRWAAKLRPDLFKDAAGRPLRGLAYWHRVATVSPWEYAAKLGKDNFGGFWVPGNAVVLRLAAARSGKSVAQADRIIEHRGPVVVTSIRTDLLDLTAGVRERRSPIYVYNPAGVGGRPNTLKRSVLAGCRDMTTAIRRADQLIGEANSEEREHWNREASRVLAPLLYASAHADGNMRLVARWVAASGTKAKNVGEQIREILLGTPEGGAQIEAVDQFFGMVGAAERTRMSITNSMQQALAWLGNPRMAAIGDPDGEEELFDIERDLIEMGATVYIMGAQTRITAPLTNALVSEIAHQAEVHAACQDGGRLSPALLFALDELATTVPGPVPQWTRYFGGFGMLLDLSAQERSALDTTWGESGRNSIWTNAAVRLVGAGGGSAQELADYEKLSGTRWAPQYDAKGNLLKENARMQLPVVSVQDFQELKVGQVIALSRGPVTRLHTPNAETRKDVRRWQRTAPLVRATNYEEKDRARADEASG